MNNSEHKDGQKTHADIIRLGFKAKRLENLKADEGIYYLYGTRGEYLETCVYHNADKRSTTILLKDLNRVAEYVPEDFIPWNWLRRNGITSV